MIPPKSEGSILTTLEVDSDDEVDFTIGNPRLVMESLAKLYSNREKAVAREYSTNARDSHVMADKADVPIEVSLPTVLSPEFIVTDHGCGMSKDEVKYLYTSFGDSNKRTSNLTNGTLGYGCKSAVAYTNSFTVVSVKDNFRTVAMVTKTPERIRLSVVDYGPTDEPNGTQVRVPVHNPQEFSTIAKDFYRFWESGTVLIDGEPNVQDVGEKIFDDLYYSTSGLSYVVMSGVGYKILNPHALFNSSKISQFSFIAYVENGEVEFTPSREDLEYSPKTKEKLAAIIADFEEKMISLARTEVAAAKTPWEAYYAWANWCGKIGKRALGDLDYKGLTMIDQIMVSGRRSSAKYGSVKSVAKTRSDMTDVPNTVFITGASYNKANRERAMRYLEQQPYKDDITKFFFINRGADMTDVKSVWVDPSHIWDWDVVKANTKLPRAPRGTYGGRTKTALEYDYYSAAGWQYGVLPSGVERHYIDLADTKGYYRADVREFLQVMNSSAVVAILPQNRVNKYKRDNPGAMRFIDWARPQVITNGDSLLSEKVKKVLAEGSTTARWVGTMKPYAERFADKRIAKAVDKSIAIGDGMGRYNQHKKAAAAVRLAFQQHSVDATNEWLTTDYPLLTSLSPNNTSNIDELVVYMNAKHASRKDAK